MNTKSAEAVHVPVILGASDRSATDVNEVAALKSEIHRLTSKIAQVEEASKHAITDRDSKMHGLLIKLVELEPYPAKYRELESRFRVTVAERDARILELEKRLESFEARVLDDPATRRPRANPERDDLKQIHGIGDQLEVLLNSLGVRWYRQIASWSGDDISFYSSKLDHFPGRIDREHWVERARELHERKYGEKL